MTKIVEDTNQRRNGVTRPYNTETGTGRIWAIADELSAKKGRPVKRAELLNEVKKEGLPVSTASSQFYLWRRFYGLVGTRG